MRLPVDWRQPTSSNVFFDSIYYARGTAIGLTGKSWSTGLTGKSWSTTVKSLIIIPD